MTCVLDAYPLIALARDEPAAEEVEMVLRRGDCVVSAVNFAETIDVLGRVHGAAADELRAAYAMLIGEAFTIVAADAAVAWRAAELRRRFHRRRDSELSLADCVALATVGPGDTLATADPPLARAARAEGVEVVALPDTSGRRP